MFFYKKPEPKPQFQLGEIVKSKISGDKGQILFINRKPYSDCERTYDVRFGSKGLKTNTPLIIIEYVREFELEKWED